MKKNLLYIFLLGFLAAAPSLISSGILYYLYTKGFFALSLTTSQAILFVIITTFTMALAISPTTLIAILSGYFFSWAGLLGVIASYATASVIGLWVGKGLCRKGIYLHEKKSKVLHESFQRLEQKQFWFIFFARLSPVLPFAMTNIALSNLKLTKRNYILGSILGMMPRTFAFFYAGKNAGDIWNFIQNPSLTGFWKVLPVVLLVLSTMGIIGVLKPKR